MKIENLKYFLAVVRAGSIHKAAEELYLTPQNLGIIIRNIEKEAGAELLVRTPKGVSLTSEGERFLPHAQAIVDAYDSFFAERKPESNIVKLYTTSALVDLLEDLQGIQLAGKYYLSMQQYSPADLLEVMKKKVPGFYFMAIPARAGAQITQVRNQQLIFTEDTTVLVAHREHPVLRSAQPLSAQLGQYLGITTGAYGEGYTEYLPINSIAQCKKMMREQAAVYSCQKYYFHRYFQEPEEWVILRETVLDQYEYRLFWSDMQDTVLQQALVTALKEIFS